MFYVLFPIPFLIMPNTALLALMNLCFHRAINTQSLSPEKLDATDSITIYIKRILIYFVLLPCTLPLLHQFSPVISPNQHQRPM